MPLRNVSMADIMEKRAISKLVEGVDMTLRLFWRELKVEQMLRENCFFLTEASTHLPNDNEPMQAF